MRLFYSHKRHRCGPSIPASILHELFCSSGRSGHRLEKGRGGVGVTGARASLKSGFQLNPWLSSKRRRKMTEVHDMARSPRPAKPFHFSPFVSLQLLIFMIAQPSRSPRHTRTHSHPLRNKKKKIHWQNSKPESQRLSFVRLPQNQTTQRIRETHPIQNVRLKNRWIISQANLE